MAFTTWNPSDKAAGVTLSNGNLTATTNNQVSGVRAIDKQITGKFYWECTCSFAFSAACVGIARSTVDLTTVSVSVAAAGTSGVRQSNGVVYVDGVATGSSLGAAITAGTVICIAVDCAASLIWYRAGAAGNWNGSAIANPATGVGGVPVNLGNALPVYPWFVAANTSDAVTANFGGSAFTGAVPAGFTSGFVSGVTSPTNVIATQSALEQFASTNPPAQVTQVTIEQWATTATISGQAMVTQVALEQWVPAAKPPVELAGALTLSLALAGDLSSISISYVDLTGNLGGLSSYGVLKYGKGHYSRVDFFAPLFAADLDVHVSLIDLVGDLVPQIALGGSLSLLVPLDSLEGSFGFEVVYGASSFISGPLWAISEPCPVPPWVASEPCPPSLWTPIPPPTFAAPTGGWTKQEKTDGLSVWGGAAQ